MRNKVLFVGSLALKAATKAVERLEATPYFMTVPYPLTEKDLRGYASVVIVVPRSALAERLEWHKWLKQYVYGHGVSVSWFEFYEK
jgi:hypothetical protein